MGTIRAFVALELPERVKEELSRLIETLRRDAPDYRWVNPATMHLTMRFLGELEPETFSTVAAKIEEGFAPGGPLRLTPAGLGAFASARKARVVWVGVEDRASQLPRLFHQLEARLETVGIERDPRGFTPHLTLGRAGRARKGGKGRRAPPNLSRLLSEHENFGGPDWEAREVLLFESRLKPGGALHTVRARGAIT